MTVVVHDNIL